MIDLPWELAGDGDLAESFHGFSALLCRGGEGGDNGLLWTNQQAVASLTIDSELGHGFD
jgi:hypothetical protein